MVQAGPARVAHHAHDGHPRRVGTLRRAPEEAAADGVHVGEVDPDERLIDDRHTGRLRTVRFGEGAAGYQFHARRPEEVGGRGILHHRELARALVEVRAPLHGDAAHAGQGGEEEIGDGAHVPSAGDSRQPLFHLPVEFGKRGPAGISGTWQEQGGADDVLGVESGLDGPEVDEAPDQQSGTHEQCEGEAELPNHEGGADPGQGRA